MKTGRGLLNGENAFPPLSGRLEESLSQGCDGLTEGLLVSGSNIGFFLENAQEGDRSFPPMRFYPNL
jgi:hypothetical protein